MSYFNPFSEFAIDPQSLRELNRHEKSLGLLTEKFVQLLKDAPDGVLDIKAVSANSLLQGVLDDLFCVNYNCDNL